MENEFITIPEYSNYKINRLGQVYSIKRGIILRPLNMKMRTGACAQAVFISGDTTKRTAVYIHKLLAITFIPNPNGWLYVGHKDKDPLNNALDNLYWRQKRNENRSPLQRLTAEQALDIYKLSQNRKRYEINLIAKLFNVQVQTINKIKNKTLWANIH